MQPCLWGSLFSANKLPLARRVSADVHTLGLRLSFVVPLHDPGARMRRGAYGLC